MLLRRYLPASTTIGAIAYRVHKGFAHAAALSAGVQRMVRSDTGASGVMFTIDTESGFDRGGFHHRVVWPRRNRRAGSGEPRRVLRLQAQPRCRTTCDLRKLVGAKAVRMVFASEQAAGRSVKTEDVPDTERDRFSITTPKPASCALRSRHRAPLRPTDGHRVGPRRRQRQALHPQAPGTVKSQEGAAEGLKRYRLKGKSEVLATVARSGRRSARRVRRVKSAAEMERVQAGDVLVTQ